MKMLNRRVTSIALALVILTLSSLVAGCAADNTPKATDNPALASKASAAFDSIGGGDAIYATQGDSDGTVVVQLKIAKTAIGSDAQVEELGLATANVVFSGVPEAKSVLVVDGNKDLLGSWDRP